MSFYSPGTPGRESRADAHREAIENDVAGRRLVKEAEREEALEEGKPLHRAAWSQRAMCCAATTTEDPAGWVSRAVTI